jgi:hypothetical protein
MTARKVCKEHLSLVERVAKIEGKLDILIGLGVFALAFEVTLQLILKALHL